MKGKKALKMQTVDQLNKLSSHPLQNARRIAVQENYHTILGLWLSPSPYLKLLVTHWLIFFQYKVSHALLTWKDVTIVVITPIIITDKKEYYVTILHFLFHYLCFPPSSFLFSSWTIPSLKPLSKAGRENQTAISVKRRKLKWPIRRIVPKPEEEDVHTRAASFGRWRNSLKQL